MSLYLGIDGGGTKTRAVIVAADGRVIGEGAAGPSLFDAVGVEVAQANIEAAVCAAQGRAPGVHGARAATPFASAFLAIAGVVSDKDKAVVRGVAQALALAPTEQIGIDHDCRAALAGGLSGRPGIVLIAGTGSSCFGVNAAGQRWLAGGWGHLISDEGSSYWLGLNALRAVARQSDGRLGRTALAELVRARLGLVNPWDLLHRLYVDGISKTEIAALASMVVAAASGGDAEARRLIDTGMADLAECVDAVARTLQLSRDCELVLVGGLFNAGDTVTQPLRVAMEQRSLACRIVWPELPPVLGAAVLALQLAGLGVDDQVRANLRASAAATA